MAVDWSIISGVAAAVSAIAAAVAAYLSLDAMRTARAMAAEQRAQEFVRKYLELAIQFPELSTEGSLKEKAAQRYEWFVGFTLMMAREVLRAYPNDQNWRVILFEQLRYNKDELEKWKKADANYFASLGSDVQKLVNEVLAEKKPA